MTNLWRRRELIREFVLLDLRGRYRSAYLGFCWALLQPLALLAAYAFLVRVLMKPPWAGEEFLFELFCGIVVFNCLGECLLRAPLLMVSQRAYVKKLIFPTEILPVSLVGSAAIHSMIGLSVLLAAMLACGRPPSPHVLLVPLVCLPLALLCLGVSWALALIGAYARDVVYAMPFLAQLLFFLTPILYPVEAVPQGLRPYFRLNPIAVVVDGVRDAVLHARAPDAWAWSAAAFVSAAACVLGYSLFMRAKTFVADSL